MDATERRARLARSRLYLVLEARPHGGDPTALLDAALRGGVDVVQLREKDLAPDELVRAAEPFRRVCDAHGALFVLNDRPELVGRCGADGVHVGQGDAPLAEARRAVGPERLVGLSASSPDELRGDADYFGVGAVFGTPTKPDAAPGGLELLRAARDTLRVPWFAIGGVELDTVERVAAAGAPGVAVVRALRDADDPAAAAAALRAALPPARVVVSEGDAVWLPQVDWLPAAGGSASPHVHAAHADVFHVLAGTLELRLGDETLCLPAGSCAAAPPLLVHGFRSPEPAEARYLNLHAPGGWARGRAAGLPREEHDELGPERASPRVRGQVTGPGGGDRVVSEHRTALVRAALPELDVLEYVVDDAYDGAGAHVHLRHADCFHVLEGALELVANGRTIRADAGTSVLVPPGVAHAFTSAGRARFLNVHAPSCSFVEYLRAVDAGVDADATRFDVHDL